jgi:hypothetical protein
MSRGRLWEYLENQNSEFGGVRSAPHPLEALVPQNLDLSQEMVQEIVRKTHPGRALSQFKIERLASRLNLALSNYERRKQLLSEPTPLQLRKQISALHKALRQLKLALPAPEQNSLRNYLIHLGEEYAEPRGGHLNLRPHYVGVTYLRLENGMRLYIITVQTSALTK